MSDKNASNASYEKILSQHTRLRTMLDELKQLLFEQSVAFTEITDRLQQLRKLVECHFRTEEDSGCFGEVVNHAPRVSDKVGALIEEHEGLSVEIAELESRATGCQGQAADWEEIGSRFAEFMARLMQHETIENELLQQVFTEDIGSKD